MTNKTKSIKLFKNLKITYGIIILFLLAMVSIISVGTISYFKLNNINDNMDELANIQLEGASRVGEIDGSVGNLRNTLTKLTDRKFDSNYITTLDELSATINKDIDQEISTIPDKDGKDKAQTLKKSFTDYTVFVEGIKKMRAVGDSPNQDFVNANTQAGTTLAKSIKDLSQYHRDQSQLLKSKSHKDFTSAIQLLITIVVFLLVVGSFLALTILTSVKSSVKEFTDVIKAVSLGNLTVEIDTSGTNEFGLMNRSLYDTVESISMLMGEINDRSENITKQAISLSTVSEQMSSTVQEVSNAIGQVAEGSTYQASELVGMTSILTDFGDSIDTVLLTVNDVNSTAQGVSSMANNSNTKLHELVSSVHEMNGSFETVVEKINKLVLSVSQINAITSLINSIADQTNLLALNAAIEAARAGDSGKGFAVVADEIRNLAEQSKTSSTEISTLVSDITTETNTVLSTTKNVSDTMNSQINVIDGSITSFREIIEAIETIIPQINKMSQSMEQITHDKISIIQKIESSSAVAEENAASSEQISASTHEMSASSSEVASAAEKLSQNANVMFEAIKQFKVK